MLPARFAPAHRESWSTGVAIGRIFTIWLSISLSSNSGDASRATSVESGPSTTCLPPATPATSAMARVVSPLLMAHDTKRRQKVKSRIRMSLKLLFAHLIFCKSLFFILRVVKKMNIKIKGWKNG